MDKINYQIAGLKGVIQFLTLLLQSLEERRDTSPSNVPKDFETTSNTLKFNR